jgi:alkanesulfonate monooxygenase SsuD/methylene tetrahydromethanopterin reductase-like flavin-dependent oxidoreductase (luciferase family)
VKFGFVLPGGTAPQQLEMAILADQHGWDGVFVWEAAYGIDAWSLLAAMAVRTEQVKLGTMLTPLPWRRPWKVASQVVTLDQLSDGRAILAVGLGAIDNFLGNTGEELDRKVRAAMMDEGIDLIKGLWRGDLRYSGEHYHVDLVNRTDLAETAQPVQAHIPIWVVGAWPSDKSMTRVLRCDGILPNVKRDDQFVATSADDIRSMLDWLRERGGAGEGFDFVVEGETLAGDDGDAREKIGPLRDAGATWWLETRWDMPHGSEERLTDVRRRIEAGPPTWVEGGG